MISIEHQGTSGAIVTDAITAESVVNEVSRITGFLVPPTQVFGMAQHYLGFPITMSFKSDTLKLVLHNLVISLVQNGFERIYFIN